MTVLPVRKTFLVMFSRARLSRLPVVGQKCRSAREPTIFRFISSGKGDHLS